MKQLILDIEESKFKAFVSFIKTLDYVAISKEYSIPQWQQDEVKRRSDLVAKGRMKTRSWDNAKTEVFGK